MSSIAVILDRPTARKPKTVPTPHDKALRELARMFAGTPGGGIYAQHTNAAWFVSDSYAARRFEHDTVHADALVALFASQPAGGLLEVRRSGAYAAAVTGDRVPDIAEICAMTADHTPVAEWVDMGETRDKRPIRLVGAVNTAGPDHDAVFHAEMLRAAGANLPGATAYTAGPRRPVVVVVAGTVVGVAMPIRDTADPRNPNTWPGEPAKV